MKSARSLFLCAVSLIIVARCLPVLAAEPPKAWTAELTLQVQRVDNVQVSPDGQEVAYAVRQAVMEGNRSQFVTHIHLVRADGSQPRQLTQGEKSCDDPQWSPDGKLIAFISDRVEKKNVWLIRPDGGEAWQLTQARGGVSSFRWSPDGRHILFVALDPPTDEDQRRTAEKDDARVLDEQIKLNRLYVTAVEAPVAGEHKARLLTEESHCVAESARGGRAAYDWSPDGKTVVFSHVRTPSPDHWTTADVSTVDVASGKVTRLSNLPAAETAPTYSPDGRWIALVVSNDPPSWGGARRVHVVAAEGGTLRSLADTYDGFGRYSEIVGWSADSSRIYFTEAHGTDLQLSALPLQGPVEPILRRPGMGLSGVHLNYSRTHVGWAWETTDQPAEAWISSVSAFEPRQVSQINRHLPALPLGRTEVVAWKSTEGFEIEGLLTYPVDYRAGQRYPLLLVVHGGPMGVFSKTFTATANSYPVAVFAARGYAVLRANPRGSSGYGGKFRHANYGDWGGGDYRDLMSGVDHVVKLGVADEKRLGVMGWSYGGFMTSWIITQTKRFQCASVGAGVTNLMSFTGTADIPGFLPDYFGGEFWDQPAAYSQHSAMFQIKGVTTPTLIQHGERDERVPLSQGLELYNALKRQGCPTKMVVYPRTPHGIDEPRLILDAMRRNIEWFDKYLAE